MTKPAPAHWVDHDPVTSDAVHNAAVIAVAETLFAVSSDEAPQALSRLDYEVADMRQRIGGKGMFVFGLSVFALYWIAPLWSLTLPTLARHSLEKRADILERWERSPFGMSLFAVKAILCIVWFEGADAAAGMKFDGQPLRTSRPLPGSALAMTPSSPQEVSHG